MIEEEYYTREYEYLQKAGNEFAEKHKSIAKFLNIREPYQKDPFVERLCEAFAFLSGTIHRRLDDDFPEITGALLEHIFPQLLRPFPACSVLQVEMPSQQMTKPVMVERGAEVQGNWKEGGRQFESIFQTTQPINVFPVSLGMPVLSEDRKTLRLPFHLRRNVKLKDLALDSLRLYINATESRHYALLYFLLDAVARVELEIGDKTMVCNEARFEIAGLGSNRDQTHDMLQVQSDDDDDFINGQFSGHRLLLEYFSFVQRFFYLDLIGLKSDSWPDDTSAFTIAVSFDEPFGASYQLTDKDILFNTVPVVNLFSGKGHVQPLVFNGKRAEYEVRPYPEYQGMTEVYAVNRIRSTSTATYIPTSSFEVLHAPEAYPLAAGRQEASVPDDEPVFYSTSIRRVEGQLAKCFVQLIQDDAALDFVIEDKVSVETLVTNGNYPNIRLAEGAITSTRGASWNGLGVKNVIRPTEVKLGTKRQDYLWSFIAHMTTNLRTIAERDTLRQLLSLYNWSPNKADSSHRKIEEGLVRVHAPVYKTKFVQGGFMRVLEIKVDVDLPRFEFGEGDLYLFGKVLSHFLSEYASFNTHVVLHLQDISDKPARKKDYTWEPTPGNIALI